MGIFSSIVTWPLAPVRGVMTLGELIQRRAEQEMRNPATTRKQLEALQEARERGEVSPEEEDEAQDAIIDATIAPGVDKKTPPKDG
jgi:hypothetical protein